MKSRALSACRAVVAAVALTVSVACEDASQPVAPDPRSAPSGAAESSEPGRHSFTVYTQNAYLGGDTGPIFAIDFANIPAVIQATNVFWSQVKASRIPERAVAIVEELATRRPHMVGLQEVTQFVVLDLGAGGAVVESLDLLGSIQAEIAQRGLPYELVRVQQNSVVTLPLSPRLVLRTIDRVAVLRRTDVTLGPITSVRRRTATRSIVRSTSRGDSGSVTTEFCCSRTSS